MEPTMMESQKYVDRDVLASQRHPLIPLLIVHTGVSFESAWVYLSLLWYPGHAGEDGTCKVRLEVLAGMGGITIKETQRYLDELVSANLLEPIPGLTNHRFLWHEWMFSEDQ